MANRFLQVSVPSVRTGVLAARLLALGIGIASVVVLILGLKLWLAWAVIGMAMVVLSALHVQELRHRGTLDGRHLDPSRDAIWLGIEAVCIVLGTVVIVTMA